MIKNGVDTRAGFSSGTWEPSSQEIFSLAGNWEQISAVLKEISGTMKSRKYLKKDHNGLPLLGMDLWNQWKCLSTI